MREGEEFAPACRAFRLTCDMMRAERQQSLAKQSNDANRRVGLRVGRIRRMLQDLQGFGYEQSDMAWALCVSPSTYARMEQGRVPITVGKLELTAEALNVPAEVLASPVGDDDLMGLWYLVSLYRGMGHGQRQELVDGVRSFMRITH